MTWSYAQDIDGATVQDDASITFGTDYGTIKVCVSECGLSTKYSFDNSAYGVGSDTGYGGGSTSSGASANTMQYGSNISSYNNIQYHLPADLLPLGMTFKAAISGLDLGGGKAVIIGDADIDKTKHMMMKFGDFVVSFRRMRGDISSSSTINR